MRIERFERITGYRIFRDFHWPDDLLDFPRYNLFYGWNGVGKTTLSSIFAALQASSSIVTGDVRLRIDGDTRHGKDFGLLNAPPIRVFNRDTVNRTFFEDPNKELPPVYYLGEESAEKQREVLELKDEVTTMSSAGQAIASSISATQNQLEKFSTAQAAKIKMLLTSPGGGPYNNYHKGNFEQDAQQIISGQKPGFCLIEKEKEKLIATKNGSPLDKLQTINLPSIDYPKLVSDVDKLLKRSIVSSVIDELANSPELSRWVQQGLFLHTGENESETCHFCKQTLPQSRIEALEAHFNDELSRFQRDIDQLVKQLEGYTEVFKHLDLPSPSLFYSHLRESYEKRCSAWSASKLSLMQFLQALVDALKQKRNEPFCKLEINEVIFALTESSDEAGWFMKVFAGLLDVAQNFIALLGLKTIDHINQIIADHNQHTDDFSGQVKRAREALAVDLVSREIGEYQGFQSEIKRLRQQQSVNAHEIYQKRTRIMELEQDIREHRKAADELNEEMRAYLGRDELKFEPSNNGYRITRNGQAALHMSEGERTAISFMYFLKTLEDEDFDLENGVVVIDDPISSLDANSMYSAFGFMKEKTKNAHQLFILTHSFSFFRLVRSWYLHMEHMKKVNKPHLHPARLYLLECVTNGAQRSARIGQIDPLLRDYESEYHYLFKTIVTEANATNDGATLEQFYALPNIARRVLEAFLSFKLPHFESGKLEKKLDEIDFEGAKKTRILRFLHIGSHNDQVSEPGHDISILSETRQILNDLLDLIREVDQEHFDGMLTLIGVSQ